MPYLDWSSEKVKVDVQHPRQPRGKVVLTLEMGEGEVAGLLSKLEGLFLNSGEGPGGLELRLSLPSGWTLFWRWREEGNLVLVAHPSADEWVGSLSLETGFWKELIERLRNLNDVGFSISQVGALRNVSNLEVRFKLLNQS